jgi:hypothetical protein
MSRNVSELECASIGCKEGKLGHTATADLRENVPRGTKLTSQLFAWGKLVDGPANKYKSALRVW